MMMKFLAAMSLVFALAACKSEGPDKTVCSSLASLEVSAKKSIDAYRNALTSWKEGADKAPVNAACKLYSQAVSAYRTAAVPVSDKLSSEAQTAFSNLAPIGETFCTDNHVHKKEKSARLGELQVSADQIAKISAACPTH